MVFGVGIPDRVTQIHEAIARVFVTGLPRAWLGWGSFYWHAKDAKNPMADTAIWGARFGSGQVGLGERQGAWG